MGRSNISFFFDGVYVNLSNRKQLKKFIQQIFKKEGRGLGNLNYIFCSDKRLLEINREYLEHDYYTDIITFDLSAPASAINGEIYISTDRVRDNARKLGNSIKSELHRVIFHGALHLCGYRDKSMKEAKLMRSKEDHYLSQYGIIVS